MRFAILVICSMISFANAAHLPNCYKAPGYLYGSFKIQTPDSAYFYFQNLGRKFLYAGFEIQHQSFNENTLIVRRYPQLNKLSDYQIRSTFTLLKSLSDQGHIKKIGCVKELP